MHQIFRKFSEKTSHAAGSAYTFIIAVLLIIIWITTGPLFHFSNTWQLVINTGTTIVTFLMVFLIQNTQNRDSKALHIKLDELIYASKKAKDKYLDTEDLTDEEIEDEREKFIDIGKKSK